MTAPLAAQLTELGRIKLVIGSGVYGLDEGHSVWAIYFDLRARQNPQATNHR